MTWLAEDLREAVRAYRHRKGLAGIAVVTLALGLGATTAIFSVVNVLLLRPPPGIAEPDRVVEVGRTYEGGDFDTFSYPDLTTLREQASPPFQGLAGFDFNVASFTRGGAGVRVLTATVSPGYFDVLGARPGAGRLFVAAEGWPPGEHPVVLLTHAFWRERFNGDPAAVGQTVSLNRRPFTVVGVLPEGFRGHNVTVTPELFVPLSMAPVLHDREFGWDNPRSHWLQVVGRLAPGATLPEARAATRTVFDRLRAASPDLYRNRKSADVRPLGAVPAGLRGLVEMFMTVLLSRVGLVLLMTCASVAALLVARTSDRERELAIRVAVGSGRGRLLRQLMVETMALFLLGGAGGLLLALWLTDVFAGIELPTPVPLALDFQPDAEVYVIELGLALVTGVAFGLAPALRASRPDVVPALKEDTGTGGRRGHRLRRTFVAAQIGLSVALLLAAGVLLRSLQQADKIARGFDAEEVYVAALDLPLDLSGFGISYWVDGTWDGEGRPQYVGSTLNIVSDGYFETLGIPVVRGRVFTRNDHGTAPPVTVVSRALAEGVWPEGDPLGKRLRFGDDPDRAYTVIGVVGDTRNHHLTQSFTPMAYRAHAQGYRAVASVVVRARPGSGNVPQAIRRAILEQDPELALSPVYPLEEQTALGLLPQRLAATLAGALGALALLLSALGIYGVVAHAVVQRTREIGLRVALGAHGSDVTRLVAGGLLWWVMPGIAAGLLVGVGLGHLARSLLIGTSPMDPVALAAVVVLLLAVGVAAAVGPTRRAIGLEPMSALRSE